MKANMVESRGIHYRTFGQASSQPLVLLMGYSASSYIWPMNFVDSLAREFYLVLIDNVGTGQSNKPVERERYAISEMASDVESVMDQLGITSAHLLGHSMGGCIALEFAVRLPQRVSSLTLMSSTAGGELYTSPTPEVLQALAMPTGTTLLERTECIWRTCVSPAFYEKEYALLLESYEISREFPTPGQALKGQWSGYRAFDRSQIPLAFPFRVTVIHGKNDRVAPFKNGADLASLIKGSDFAQLDCEHMPYLEKSEDTLAIVRSTAGVQ